MAEERDLQVDDWEPGMYEQYIMVGFVNGGDIVNIGYVIFENLNYIVLLTNQKLLNIVPFCATLIPEQNCIPLY